MIGICPYDCDNKTEFGYCKSTGCINPKYNQMEWPILWLQDDGPCKNCPGNPKNGGSGVCYCVLGKPKTT